MKKISGIYCIENVLNKKKYIGQSVDVNKRLHEHKRYLMQNVHSNRHLNDSFNLYGENNFKFYLILECNNENLYDEEKRLISFYETTNNEFGYNMLSGGEGGRKGRVCSPETREKLSKAGKRRVFSKERNLKISISKKGKPRIIPPETRKIMAIACVGNKIKTRKTTSKYRGVSFSKRDKIWRVNYRGKGYGVFKKEKDAAKRFDEVCWNDLHDPKKLNFPNKYKKINN